MDYKRLIILLALAATFGTASATSKLDKLPAAVRKTAQAETVNAEVLAVKKEKEGGKTFYEIETRIAGRTRDLVIDEGGSVVVVEEEVALADVPQVVQSTIQREAGGAKIVKIEALTKGSEKTFEAIVESRGKQREFIVSAAGALVH